VAVVFSHGAVTQINGLASSPSQARGINNLGQIVGTAGSYAFLYRDGSSVDLNTLVDLPRGSTLVAADAINDSGVIAGTMVVGGYDRHAVILTPLTPTVPTISRNPEPQSVVDGSTATFFVVANGIPLPTFQWQRSTDGGATWVALSDDGTHSGVGTPLLSVATTAPALDGYQFRAIATNTAGAATSASASLRVTATTVAPTITTQPSNVVAAITDDATLGVVASGTTPLSYQWFRGGVAIPTAIHETLSISTVQAAHAGSYTVTVSNSAGSVTSAPVFLGVMSLTPEALQFGSERSGPGGPVTVVSQAQSVAVSFNGVAPAWTATTDQPWIQIEPA
jgi:probable HAF family extracellular repeat protein